MKRTGIGSQREDVVSPPAAANDCAVRAEYSSTVRAHYGIVVYDTMLVRHTVQKIGK